MKCNIGCFERSLRILAGTGLVTLTFTDSIGAWGWIGVLPLVTGLIRYCPAYALVNRSRCCKGNKGGCN